MKLSNIKPDTILFCSHTIFLDKKERKILSNGNDLIAEGVYSFVWYIYNMESKIFLCTEPIEESFVTYEIIATKPEPDIILNKQKNGFKLILPQLPSDYKIPQPISIELLTQLTFEDKLLYEKKRRKWFVENPIPPNIEMLKDKKKYPGKLNFQMKKRFVINNKNIDNINFIDIKSKESLVKSFI